MPHVLIIGGGPGGVAAAIRAAQLGARVTLIEKGDVGGNCTNKACVPVEALQTTARLLSQLRRAQEHGISFKEMAFDLSTAVARKNQVVEEIRMGIEGLLAGNGVEVIKGKARLSSPRAIEVNGKEIAGDAVVIATGFNFARPPIDGIQEEGVITPEEALNLSQVPPRLLIIGGEPPHIALASIFSAFGSKVTLVERERRVLPGEDEEIRQRVGAALREEGVDILVEARVQAIRRKGPELAVYVVDRRGEREITVDKVLVVERIPAIEDLGLEKAGVRVDGKAIAVDERMRSSCPTIYAVGDAAGGRFSYEATAGGIVAAENIMGLDSYLDKRFIPRCIYGRPEAASVGLTQEEAEKAGYQVKTSVIPLALNARAMAMGETAGSVKIIAEATYGKILGVHIVGPWATELIDQAVLAIKLEALAEDLAEAIAGHPCLTESRQEAARDLLGKALYLPKW
ncbi:MAG: dihydrolipoyl dehydrogenase [Anaerolineae bacterium]|nr:dihydrolipoyl dehydrogenase [Anaerolineae bacterium]MDW8102014.1 dihydrolipoyl dehydrogenase [Anaerolineae bacterium]